jgi:lysozyme family protein
MSIPPHVDVILDKIIKREGRTYENVKHDKGGPTKFGITLGRLRTERGRHMTWENVRDLTEPEARAIYYDAYFKRPRIGELHPVVMEAVFDCYVTSGTWAIKLLQQILGDLGFDVRVDGELGEETLDAVDKAADAMGDDLRRAYAVERTHFFGRIVANNSTQGKFLRGWINQRSRPYFK